MSQEIRPGSIIVAAQPGAVLDYISPEGEIVYQVEARCRPTGTSK